jgi:DNA adenine methylase
LLPELTARMPKQYGKYFEPFLGSGALFFAVQPPSSCLSDNNRDLINAYTVVRDHLEELVEDLSRHPYEKEYYYRLRNADREEGFEDWTPVRKAARLIYLNKSCFNGLYRVNAKGQFNVPFGRYKNPAICDRNNLARCSRALQSVDLRCENFEAVEQLSEPGDFVYFDPPYAPVSATSNFTAYQAGGFGVEHHEALARLCNRLDEKGVRFMLSNSFTDMAMELYKRHKVEVVSAARAINAQGGGRGKVSELIVTNY